MHQVCCIYAAQSWSKISIEHILIMLNLRCVGAPLMHMCIINASDVLHLCCSTVLVNKKVQLIQGSPDQKLLAAKVVYSGSHLVPGE
jgi:hypothetical protein